MSYVSVAFPFGIDSDFQSAFDDAADFWNDVIQGSPTDPVTFGSDFSLANACGVNAFFPAGSTLEGLIIVAQVSAIDGSGGILGQAGPCLFTGNFARVGVMSFDSADIEDMLDDGSLAAVIKHEMGHVIGIGTLWQGLGILNGAGGNNPRYTGAGGRSGFQQLGGGTGNIPVENQGGAGTADGHWREATFGNEMMTGFLNSGNNPASIMTINSLIDLGYDVDASVAESYSIPKEGEQNGEIAMGLDVLNFDYVDLEAAVTENDAKVAISLKSQENFTVLAGVVAAVTAFLALVVFAAYKTKKNKLPKVSEEESKA